MNRREFFKKGSLYLSGALIAGSGILKNRAFAAPERNINFSLDVVTSQPGLAIRKIDELIKQSGLKNHRINFTEYQLPGSHIGDIAFVRSQQLINFYKLDDPFSLSLKETAKSLALPQSLENPVLLRFYSDMAGGIPQRVNIFRGNLLMHQLPIAENTRSFRAKSNHGHIDISVTDGKVKIISASCQHKTCMELGTINRPGQSLVCIPNRLRVDIEGSSDIGVDGITF